MDAHVPQCAAPGGLTWETARLDHESRSEGARHEPQRLNKLVRRLAVLDRTAMAGRSGGQRQTGGISDGTASRLQRRAGADRRLGPS
jgi:hypothetical protein